jgi:sortase A
MRSMAYGRTAASAALLLFMLLVLPACGGNTTTSQGEGQDNSGEVAQGDSGEQWETVQAVNPEDILSEEERTGLPKYRDWNEESGSEPIQLSTGTSAGPIPALKPFNFGRDPGGPADKTLYLTVPKLGIEDAPVFDSIEEEKLDESMIHVPATGFPWQGGANTYIAGHRIGYEGTASYQIFYRLPELENGDEISLKDADGDQYTYKVTEQKIVPPDNVEVMNAVAGESIITLQTCTLPDYIDRIIVQGELV